MTKVVDFPKNKIVRDIPDEVIKERQTKSDKKMADAIIEDISGIVLTELDNYPVDVETKQFSKDFILVVDSITAAVYRSFGLDHHLHPLIDENIHLLESGEGLSKEDIREQIEQLMEKLIEAKEGLDKE